MRFSHRLPHGTQRNALSELLAHKQAGGCRILDLTESNPTRAGIQYPAGVFEALADPAVGIYEPEPFGMRSARQIIGSEYGVPADQVVLTASTSEAYSWLFKLLCDPQDEVLIPRPSYPLFEYLAALESVNARHYGLFYDHGWFIDFHSLEQRITGLTKAVILVNPNNPTGHYLRRHEAGELAAICRRHDLALISDEVFSEYPIDPAPDSLQTLRGIADFTLHGLSKSAGLPQLKLAWMIAKDPPDRLEIIADTYLPVSAPVQCALQPLLAAGHRVREQIRARVRRNLGKLKRALRVEAGWFAVVPVFDEEECALRLLRDHNVLVQPGYFYDFESSGYLVVSLLTAPAVFDEGITALETAATPPR